VAVTRLPESLTPELRASAKARAGHPIFALKAALGRKELAGLLALFFFLVFGFANLESMLPLFLKDRYEFDEAHSGYVFAYIGVCIAFTQGFLLGRLVKRFGEARLLIAGPLLLAIGMQLYWLAPNLPVYLLCIPVVAIGMGFSNPCVATLISRRTPADIQGRTLGLSQSLGALARAVSPGLAGWLYGEFPRPGGSIVPFLWGGVLVFLGLFVGLPALRGGREPVTPTV
jgi:MFS transporter, DHA1 family, tetracycline resistance protein